MAELSEEQKALLAVGTLVGAVGMFAALMKAAMGQPVKGDDSQ